MDINPETGERIYKMSEARRIKQREYTAKRKLLGIKYYSEDERAENKERGLESARKYKYNLRPDEIEAMLKAQRNKCASCGDVFEETPHLDHDHATGMNRGLLCRSCNMGIGFFEDNPKRMRQAARYVHLGKIGLLIAQRALTKYREIKARGLTPFISHL